VLRGVRGVTGPMRCAHQRRLHAVMQSATIAATSVSTTPAPAILLGLVPVCVLPLKSSAAVVSRPPHPCTGEAMLCAVPLIYSHSWASILAGIPLGITSLHSHSTVLPETCQMNGTVMVSHLYSSDPFTRHNSTSTLFSHNS
jgi:hypothetical protein